VSLVEDPEEFTLFVGWRIIFARQIPCKPAENFFCCPTLSAHNALLHVMDRVNEKGCASLLSEAGLRSRPVLPPLGKQV
jgi:hypothetical protein